MQSGNTTEKDAQGASQELGGLVGVLWAAIVLEYLFKVGAKLSPTHDCLVRHVTRRWSRSTYTRPLPDRGSSSCGVLCSLTTSISRRNMEHRSVP